MSEGGRDGWMDAERGSEGTGRLKLMLDHSHRGEEGPESVY